jgi:hypothetical protein
MWSWSSGVLESLPIWVSFHFQPHLVCWIRCEEKGAVHRDQDLRQSPGIEVYGNHFRCIEFPFSGRIDMDRW